MSRARSVADLGNQNVLSVSAINGNINVGTGVTIENTGEAQFSGIVTASSIDTRNLIGNVSIGGELTYEDVTNVDSVGVITARKGLVVGSGATIVGLSTFTKVAIGGTAISSDPNLNLALLHVYSDIQETGSNQDGISVGPLPHGAGAHHLALTYNRANDTGLLSVTTGRLGLTATQGVGLGNNVGIGTTRSPGTEKLHVVGDSKFVGIVTSKSLDLEAINKDITDSAVDVFVYDTSKDSDGGAWRKRTQNTSWYNEAAAAGVRGSRKEFPAVAVIVAEATKVTIYDGDDPDLPMWMVFNVGGTAWTSVNLLAQSGASTNWSLSAVNGTICIAPVVSYRLRVINFISEYSYVTSDAGGKIYNGSISERNSGKGFYDSSNIGSTANGTFNDVAMTVLPNAPIDDATGLPIPTIAVATESGVSVIKDDGTVADITQNSPYKVANNVFFSDYGKLLYDAEDTGVAYEVDIPSSDIGYGAYNSTSNGRVIYPVGTHGGFSGGEIRLLGRNMGGGGKLITKGAFAFDENGASEIINGLTLFDREKSDPAKNSLVAFASTSYNTGWMHGDSKGAFLSDTDTTNVTGGGDGLITGNDSTFGAVITSLNWSERSGSGGGWNVSGGVLKTGTVSSGEYLDITTSGYTSGQTYVISYTLSNVTGSNPIRWRFNNGQMGNLPTSNGSHSYYVTLTETGTLFSILNDSSLTADIDNFRLQLVQEEDRSVNNFGLVQYGTITKSAVATGADLVAYSGFSASNYLQQPYNSDLDFGTGDFSIMFWFKTPSGSVPTECILHRGDGSSGWGTGKIIQIEFNSTDLAAFLSESAFSSFDTVTVTGTKAATGQWMHYTLVRSGTSVKVYLNGEVNGTVTSSKDLTNTSAKTWIGERPAQSRPATTTSLALMRMSKSAPSPEQIKKMYEDEKHLYQENAACTLYGSSDAVTALAYDEDTELLHVGTSSGRSNFRGLRRINNTTDPVTAAISASNDLVAEK